MTRGLIYRDDGANPLQDRIKALWEVVEELKTMAPAELWNQLSRAVAEVEEASKASMPIAKGGRLVGYGINASKKAIACDTAMSILKQIKAVRGW